MARRGSRPSVSDAFPPNSVAARGRRLARAIQNADKASQNITDFSDESLTALVAGAQGVSDQFTKNLGAQAASEQARRTGGGKRHSGTSQGVTRAQKKNAAKRRKKKKTMNNIVRGSGG